MDEQDVIEECPDQGCTFVQVEKGRNDLLIKLFIAMLATMVLQVVITGGFNWNHSDTLTAINADTTIIKNKYIFLEEQVKLVNDKYSSIFINQQKLYHGLNEARVYNKQKPIAPPFLYDQNMFKYYGRKGEKNKEDD